MSLHTEAQMFAQKPPFLDQVPEPDPEQESLAFDFWQPGKLESALPQIRPLLDGGANFIPSTPPNALARRTIGFDYDGIDED